MDIKALGLVYKKAPYYLLNGEPIIVLEYWWWLRSKEQFELKYQNFKGFTYRITFDRGENCVLRPLNGLDVVFELLPV